MIRKLIATAALAVAPLLVVAAGPAAALSPGQTVCYADDGTAVVNPPNPDDFASCYTNTGGSGGSGAPSGPSLCGVDIHDYGYNDGLGSTGPYTIVTCTPIVPLNG
ncbi:MAG: hypothetical protein ACLGI2_04840 [Acidimicrobiia bacterium]